MLLTLLISSNIVYNISKAVLNFAKAYIILEGKKNNKQNNYPNYKINN